MNDIYYVETIWSDHSGAHDEALNAAVERAQNGNLDVSLDFRLEATPRGLNYVTLLTARKRS